MDSQAHDIPATGIDRDAVAARLAARGIQPTVQRVEIARILFARPQHLSADRVLRIARERGLTVSKATVYNTLGLLAREGLVREVIADPARVFYDSNTDPHHHLFDVTTGTLADIDACSVDLQGLPPLPEGTVVEGVDVVVRVRRSAD